jgi:hypothetical protein
MGGYAERMIEVNEYKIVIRKLEEKKTFGRPRCRWENSIKTDPVITQGEISHIRT